MSLVHENSAVTVPVATYFGFEQALSELHAAVSGDSSLFPKEHSENFHRQQLRGEKPMTWRALDAFIYNLTRRRREAARRVLNRWLGHFGFHAVDLEHAALVLVKSPNDELLDVAVSHARLVTTVHDALADQIIDATEARSIDRAADDAIRQINECRTAARRGVFQQ